MKNGRNVVVARRVVFALVVVAFVAGLVWHTSFGTLSALGLGDIALLCPLGGLEVLFGSRGGMAVHGLILLGAALAVAVVFGKAFCSWVCPTNYVRALFRGGKGRKESRAQAGGSSEAPMSAAAAASENAGSLEPARPAASSCGGFCGSCALGCAGGARDGFRPDSRHIALVAVLAASFLFGFPVFCVLCPVGAVFGIAVALFNLIRFNVLSWGLLVFPALLVGEVVVYRKWCVHLCPISALLSLASAKTRLFRPVVDGEKCLRSKGVDCRVCVEACPELVDPHSAAIPECTKCGECLGACPVGAIELRAFPKRAIAQVVPLEEDPCTPTCP